MRPQAPESQARAQASYDRRQWGHRPGERNCYTSALQGEKDQAASYGEQGRTFYRIRGDGAGMRPYDPAASGAADATPGTKQNRREPSMGGAGERRRSRSEP